MSTPDKPDLLSEDGYGISRARDLPCAIWRTMLRDLNVGPLTWLQMLNVFIAHPRTRQMMRGKSMSSLRGNMRKALLINNRMSWRWLERGIYVLAPTKAEFVIKLHWPDGEITIHQHDIDLSHVMGASYANDLEEDMEEDDDGDSENIYPHEPFVRAPKPEDV